MSKEYALSQMEQASPEEREQNNVGDWYLDLVFEDSRDISGTLEKIAENHGYTIGESTEGTELACGINWAYTSTHSESMDAQSIFPLIGAVIVMLLTGYLIIYNVFQISVAGDVRTADPADRPVAGAFIVRDRNPDRTDLRVSDRKSADAGYHGKSG